VRLICGDCLEVLPTLAEASVDAVCTDPPYSLSFMGKAWDSELPGVGHWQAVLRVLKPGGYAAVFGGTRTYHRLACAVEDAGFEIRDCVMWLYGTGFPKGKGCLKPGYEPILLARKPGPKVLPLGIDECRVGTEQLTYGWGTPGAGRERECNLVDRGDGKTPDGRDLSRAIARISAGKSLDSTKSVVGRWPANVVHDGSEEVLETFGEFGERGQLGPAHVRGATTFGMMNDDGWQPKPTQSVKHDDTGTAARFFYTAKASRSERGEGNTHPTVKPLSLMRWLVRLVCPPGGIVLDPFLGSGTTALACRQEGRECVGIERDPAYFAIAERRLAGVSEDAPLFAAAAAGGE
jgi:hypothetical protein